MAAAAGPARSHVLMANDRVRRTLCKIVIDAAGLRGVLDAVRQLHGKEDVQRCFGDYERLDRLACQLSDVARLAFTLSDFKTTSEEEDAFRAMRMVQQYH